MRTLAIITAFLVCVGCKSDPPPVIGDGPGTGSRDARVAADARPPPCNGTPPTAQQCSNCIDDDNDGYIDSLDVECTRPLEQDESSFATGIPGENSDPVNQDCFFDGDTGAGNDGCNIHVCCVLGATTQAQCPIGANRYNPGACPPPIGVGAISQMCLAVCRPYTLPGCDCFGCCTLCDRVTNVCHDVAVSPILSPGCTLQNIADGAVCKSCTKTTACGNPTCGGTSCILCPGQEPSDLPSSCGGTPACPTGSQSCMNSLTCPAGTYCHQGSRCCVAFAPFVQ